MKRFIFFCILLCNVLHSQVPALLKDIHPGADSSRFGNYFVMPNHNVLFDVLNSGLWVTDGSSNGTMLLKPRSSGNLTGKSFIDYSGKTYFFSPTPGYSLWRTDGTRAGTDSILTSGTIQITSLVKANNLLLFFSYDANGTSLWRSDGTSAGTYTLAFFTSGEEVYDVINNILYFKEYSSSEGFELWRSDGTNQGTFMLKDIRPGTLSSLGSNSVNPIIISQGNHVYFTANDGQNGQELWRTDGTQAGTILLKDINAGSTSSYLNRNDFWKANNGIYFLANNQVNGEELWFSDGSSIGTHMIQDAATGTNSARPQKPAFINNHAYYYYLDYNNFNTQNISNQHLIFKTDGTTAGTSSLAISPWYNATTYITYADEGFHEFNNELFFSMYRKDNLTNPAKDTILLCKLHSNFTSYSIVSKIPIDTGLAGGMIYPFPKLITLQGNKLLYTYHGLNNNGLALAIFDLSTGSNKIHYKLGPSTPSYNTDFKFYNVGNKVYYPFPPTNDLEPAYINLLTDSVYLLKNINPLGSSYNCSVTPLNGIWNHQLYKLFNKHSFFAYEQSAGQEFYETDFTPSGTKRVLDIHPGPKNFDKNNLQNTCNNKFVIETPNNIYFGADDGIHGFELWSFINSPNNPLNVEDIASNENQFLCFPNPASTSIQIKANKSFSSKDQIQLLDLLGRQVKLYNSVEGTELNLNIADVNNGIYFIKIAGSDKKIDTQKVIVSH